MVAPVERDSGPVPGLVKLTPGTTYSCPRTFADRPTKRNAEARLLRFHVAQSGGTLAVVRFKDDPRDHLVPLTWLNKKEDGPCGSTKAAK